MSISQTITSLSTPPSRSDPTNFDARADAFLGALPTLATEINTWAGQANSTATTVNSDKSSAKSSATAAATSASAAAGSAAAAGIQASSATATQAAIEQALDTVSGETASVVAHAAAADPHPLLDSRLIGQLGYLLDQIALETKRNAVQDATFGTYDDGVESATAVLTYALDLISVVAKAITGGRAAFIGGSAATPAITIGNAGLYQSAANTLSVALAGSEVFRITTSGIKCVDGSVTSL